MAESLAESWVVVGGVVAILTLLLTAYGVLKPSSPRFRRYDRPISGSEGEFTQFVRKNEGRIVYIRASVDGDSANVDEHEELPRGKRLIFAHDMVEYVFFASPNEERWYWTNGYYAIDGYFSIELVQGMHQGWVSIVLRGLDTAPARLKDRRGR